MEYIIIYFSGTGNTELIAKEIKSRLENRSHSVELVSIENQIDLRNLNFENKVIGFGYPVYKFTYPEIFDRMLPLINQLAKEQRYFQFSTYARFYAYAFSDFSEKLDYNKYQLIGEKAFKSPSCGISCRKPVEDYEYQSVMFFEDHINKKLDEFVDLIIDEPKQKLDNVYKKEIMSEFKKSIVKDIEKTKYPKLQIDQEKCVICGLCANRCPDKNLIILKENIEIIDTTSCLHCLRCMNHCPVNAINFGELTKGDNQYTLKIRDELYEKSSNGYCEKYWANFKKVIKKWKRNTLKYWIFHKIGRE